MLRPLLLPEVRSFSNKLNRLGSQTERNAAQRCMPAFGSPSSHLDLAHGRVQQFYRNAAAFSLMSECPAEVREPAAAAGAGLITYNL